MKILFEAVKIHIFHALTLILAQIFFFAISLDSIASSSTTCDQLLNICQLTRLSEFVWKGVFGELIKMIIRCLKHAYLFWKDLAKELSAKK